MGLLPPVLNNYKNLQVFKSPTSEGLAELIRSFHGQNFTVISIYFDGTDHTAYVVSQYGFTKVIRNKTNGN